MRRGQVFVLAIKADGTWGSVDALNLDDESFRAFILDRLLKAEVVAGLQDRHSGELIILKERKDE